MALTTLGIRNTPNYLALSTDIVNSKIPGIDRPGKLLLITDTGIWYIVGPDLTLIPYAEPISAALTGDIEIGAVEIKNAADDTRAKVGVSTAIAESDAALAVHNPTMGVTTDAPDTTAETGTAKTGISLWKSIKNYLKILVDGFTKANVARTVDTLVLPVQIITSAGAVVDTFGGSTSAANTGRSTATLVSPVQIVDASGNVYNLTPANTGRSTATPVQPVQLIDAAGNVYNLTAANTGRSTATLVQPVQVIDAAGNVLSAAAPPTAANTGRSTATLVQPVQIVDAAGLVMPAPANGQATMANSSPVVLASDQSSLQVKGAGLDFSVNLTVTNGVYSVGDVVGGLISITGAVSANGKSLLIDSITLAGQTSAIPFELWLLNADLATANVLDNGVFTLAAADVPKMLGVIPIAAIDQYQGQNAIFCASVPVGRKIKAGAATTSIYAYIKALATTSPGVAAMTLNINGRWVD